MPDPVAEVLVIVGLVLVGALLLSFGVADAVRDSDWWVIARGTASGKRARLVRLVRGVRRG